MGGSRSLLQSFLIERHKLASRNHPHLIRDCDRPGVRNSRLRDYALPRTDATRSPVSATSRTGLPAVLA
jgi:hypothetical protein